MSKTLVETNSAEECKHLLIEGRAKGTTTHTHKKKKESASRNYDVGGARTAGRTGRPKKKKVHTIYGKPPSHAAQPRQPTDERIQSTVIWTPKYFTPKT